MKIFLFCAAAVCAVAQPALRMNEIQVIGTHNSYHAGIAPSEAKLMAERNQKGFDSLDYRHARLADQLSAGVRQIELDVWADAAGGLFANPLGPKMVADAGLLADAPYEFRDAMKKPGMKVLHMQDVDYRSTCPTLVECLQEVKAWSKAHPKHVPVFILIETKQEDPKEGTPYTRPEHFTSATFDSLDGEIRGVFGENEMITPNRVRGKFATLNEAVRKQGWPTLDEARGRVVFLMDQRPVGEVYLKGHPSLRGRVIFTNAAPGADDAAFVESNDGSAEAIGELVKAGYIVRTRSDAETKQGRTGDVTRRDEALRSGAQMVSTDYPASEPARWSGYAVALPGGAAARCNPVLKPAGCPEGALE